MLKQKNSVLEKKDGKKERKEEGKKGGRKRKGKEKKGEREAGGVGTFLLLSVPFSEVLGSLLRPT